MKNRRDKELAALWRRGHATIVEILRAEFGGDWPPKGLDLAVEPKWRVNFHSVVFGYLPTLDMLKNFSRRLFEHPKSAMKGFGKQGYETFQHYRVTGGYVKNKDTRNIFLRRSDPQSKASAFGHELDHILFHIHDQFFREMSPRTAIDDFWKTARNREGVSYNAAELDYLEQAHEIQARLHECAAEWYLQWGRIPLTKQDLWAALESVGVVPPQEIHALNKARAYSHPNPSTPIYSWSKGKKTVRLRPASDMEGHTRPAKHLKDAYKVLGMAPKEYVFYGGDLPRGQIWLGISPGKDIDKVQSQISGDENKMRFWTEILPLLYGEYLERLGDAQGLKRMGFSQNESLATSWLGILRGDPDNAYTKADFRRWAKAVEPKKRFDILRGLCESHFLEKRDVELIETLMEFPETRMAARGLRNDKGQNLLARTSWFNRPDVVIALLRGGASRYDSADANNVSFDDLARSELCDLNQSAKKGTLGLLERDIQTSLQKIVAYMDSHPEIKPKKPLLSGAVPSHSL